MNKHMVIAYLSIFATFSASAMIEVKSKKKEMPIHRIFFPSTATNSGKELLIRAKRREKQENLRKEEYLKREECLRQKEEYLKQKEEHIRQECLYLDLLSAVNAVDKANVQEIIRLATDPALQNRELAKCINYIYGTLAHQKPIMEPIMDIRIDDQSLFGYVTPDDIRATAHKIYHFVVTDSQL